MTLLLVVIPAAIACAWAIRSTPDAAAAPATEPVSPRALTTEELASLHALLGRLRTVAVEFRRNGRTCCAQQAEQYATRLAEAIERSEAA